MKNEYIIDDDIFKVIVDLATATEKNILKARKCYISLECEEYEKLKEEILSSMSKILEEKTKYLTEQKEIALAEIDKLKKLKYDILSTLEQQDSRYKNHIFLERYPQEVKIATPLLGDLNDEKINKIALSRLSRKIIGIRCVICRQNFYGEIQDPNYCLDNSENIIPRSIYEESKKYGEYSLEEINTKLYNLYLRYQALSQVSYNICALFGHNRKYHHSSEFECTRCEMTLNTFYEFRSFKSATIKPREFNKEYYVIPALRFIHLDYDFDSLLPFQCKNILSFNKKRLIKELSIDIKGTIKEEDIVVDDEVFKETVSKIQETEKKKVKVKKVDYSKTWYY